MQNDDVYERLKGKSVIVVTHVYGTGASQDLVRFLNDHKTRNLLFIGHPLFYDPNLSGSGYEIYDRGVLVQKKITGNRRIPLFIGYILHILKSFAWVLRTGRTWDLYVGSNCINAVVGIVLQKLGIVKKTVYYVIDFNPVRYDQPFVNALYQRLDQYCVIHADETWNMSPRMKAGRRTYFGFSGGNQKVVPVGLWLSDCISLPIREINPHKLVFVGHIQEKQGIQYVLRAIPAIVKKVHDFTFLIIGGGDYLSRLQVLSRELGIAGHVEFSGYIKDHREIDKLLVKSALGVALYDRKDGDKISFSYFGNPTKVKVYQSAGLPVLISDVPYNTRELEESGCAKIVSYEPRDIARAVTSLLLHDRILRKYRDNVVAYRVRYDWNSIFSKNLRNLL